MTGARARPVHHGVGRVIGAHFMGAMSCFGAAAGGLSDLRMSVGGVPYQSLDHRRGEGAGASIAALPLMQDANDLERQAG